MDELNPTSKIGRRTTVAQPESKAVAGEKSKTSGVDSGDRVTLSAASREESAKNKEVASASEVRYDLVKKFRNVLDDGSYVVKANEIAEKIVQKIRENKNPTLF